MTNTFESDLVTMPPSLKDKTLWRAGDIVMFHFADEGAMALIAAQIENDGDQLPMV